MGICGIHIGREYITLARRDGAEAGVDSIGIQPLGAHGTHHNEVIDGLKEMAEKNLFIKKEPVVLSFDSSATHTFMTKLPSEITDIHEMMSWELMVRVNDPISNYAFDAVPSGIGKAIGVAVRDDEIHFYKKLCRKFKLNMVAVDTDLLTLFNLYELNYDTGTPALVIAFDVTSITIIFIKEKTIQGFKTISAIDSNTTLEKETGRITSEVQALLAEHGESSFVPMYITGEHLADFTLREVLLKTLPQCELLNPFKKLPSRAGMDEDSIERFSPLITVAVGLSQKDL